MNLVICRAAHTCPEGGDCRHARPHTIKICLASFTYSTPDKGCPLCRQCEIGICETCKLGECLPLDEYTKFVNQQKEEVEIVGASYEMVVFDDIKGDNE